MSENSIEELFNKIFEKQGNNIGDKAIEYTLNPNSLDPFVAGTDITASELYKFVEQKRQLDPIIAKDSKSFEMEITPESKIVIAGTTITTEDYNEYLETKDKLNAFLQANQNIENVFEKPAIGKNHR